MSEEMKLKSCPFCGGEGEIVKCGVVCDEAYVVSCKECKVRTRLEFVQKPKADDVTNKTKEGYIKEARELAAEKWNRRSEAEAEQLEIDNALYRQENRVLQEELEKAHDEAVKDFAHFLIDKAKDGSIDICDLTDLVVEWGKQTSSGKELI